MSIRQGLRIGFMGASGTGKTTSAEFIRDKLMIPLPVSASRQIYAENNLTEVVVASMSDSAKLSLQFDIFNQKETNDQEYTYVSDRTLLDHYCYCLSYCGSFMDNDRFIKFEQTTRAHMLSTYSHLFYFPCGYWEGESDGVRSDLMGWQSQIDAIIVGYIERWDLPVVTVPQTKGLAVRNEFILNWIKGEK